MASDIPFYLDCPFKGKYNEISKGIGINATVAGVTYDLLDNFSNYKFVQFLTIDYGSDGKSHRMNQIFSTDWLINEILLDSTNVRKICFNYYRNDVDLRCWVAFHYNNDKRITFSKTSGFTDKVSLVVFGWY